MVMAGAYAAHHRPRRARRARSRGCGSRSRRTGRSTSPPTRRAIRAGSTRRGSSRPAWDAATGMSTIKSRGTVTIDDRDVQGLRALHPRLPTRVLVDDRGAGEPPRATATRELLDGCTGCAACLLVCPDFVFEVYRSRSRSRRRCRHDRVEAAPKRLMEGSEAIAEAAIAAGCRFFAGYPMTPFTELLEHFAKRLPEVGGVCINAESELEAVGMAWGALATGARAATGSTGQGLSLMQECFARDHARRAAARRSSTWRGASRTTSRRPAAAATATTATSCSRPIDIGEAVELTQLAFHLADKWRNPVLVYGDYLLAHTQRRSTIAPLEFGDRCPPKDWAVDGSLGGTGRSRHRLAARLRQARQRGAGHRTAPPRTSRPSSRAIEHAEVRVETGHVDDAETVIVAFGIAGQVRALRRRAAARRGREDRLRAADHAVAVPVRGGARPPPRRARRRRLRAVRRADDRRRAPRRARPRARSSASAGSRPTARASASGRCSTPRSIRERILALHRGGPTQLPPLPSTTGEGSP